MGGGVVGEVKQFCYLRDVLEYGGGSERAIRGSMGKVEGNSKPAGCRLTWVFRCINVELYMKHELDLLCCIGGKHGH